MIGIIGAMESEVRLLVERLEEQKEQRLGSFTFYTGKMEKQPVAVVQCGIGKCAAGNLHAAVDRPLRRRYGDQYRNCRRYTGRAFRWGFGYRHRSGSA